ncbi:MAG: hypothetical protein K0S08_653 [Gammaproteobacteria bacterium]|jgi:hypothetical protein|nr:hypothetical protein [Gammaproteobacteria bacterium]
MSQRFFRCLSLTLFVGVSGCASMNHSFPSNHLTTRNALAQSKFSMHQIPKRDMAQAHKPGNALSIDETPIQNLMA